jgi:tRNA A-37 threonylcarbamoyl transferase component Bud32
MAALLDNPDPVMHSGRLLKAGNTATLVVVKVDGKEVVIKRYNIKNFLHGFRRFFRQSRAWVSWRNAHLLTYMNIPTPQPIALMERRWGPFRKNAYFINEYVYGTPLNHVFDDKRIDAADIHPITEKVGEIIQSLVDLMIGHGDTKASNFIVTKDDIKIVDLDVMKEYTCTRKFHKAFKKDTERFMKNWSDVPEIGQKFRQMLLKISNIPTP